MVPNNLEVLDKLYEITQNEVNIYSYLNAIKNLELRNDQLITDYNKKVNDKDAENRDKFHFYIEMAKLYSMKEKKLLDSIDCLANELVDCSNIHLENIPKIYEGKHIPVYYKGITENHTQTEITENIYLYASDIYERFSNVTEVKINELISRETKAFYGANAAQIRAHKNSDAERRIRKYLNKYITILKLKHLDRAIKLETNENERKELIEYKYSLIFENKDVCDNLLGSKMDIKAFSMPDDKKMATAYQVPLENYIYLKETQILKEIEGMAVFLTPTHLDGKIIDDYDKSLIKYLLKEVSTKTLSEYHFNLQKLDNKEEATKEITEIVLEVLESRNDYIKPASELFETKECATIPKETINNFISIIKVNEKIYDLYQVLCEMEKNDKKNTEEYKEKNKHLQYYMELEKNFLEKIDLTNDGVSERLYNLSENDLSLFLEDSSVCLANDKVCLKTENEEKCKAIKERLYNMIPNLDMHFSSCVHDNEVTYHIHKNHLLNSVIKTYKNIENKDKESKNKMIEELYKESYRYPMLSEDMSLANFDPSSFIVLEEDLTASLLGTKNTYYDDKNTELYTIALRLLTEIGDDQDMDDAHMEFIFTCLDDIVDNLNYENLTGLKSHIIEEEGKNKDNSKILKLHQLVESKLPDYLK